MDLTVSGLIGQWVRRSVAYQHCRTWLRGPGVESINPTRGSRWTRPTRRGDGLTLIRGELVATLVVEELESMGVTEPDPFDYPNRKVPDVVWLRYEAKVQTAAKRVERRLSGENLGEEGTT